MGKQKRVVILGGGISGLGAAHGLLSKNQPCILLERGKTLGGLAGSHIIPTDKGRFSIEYFYHHLFSTDTTIVKLARMLDVGHNLLWKKTKMGIYHKKTVYSFSSPLDLLRFKPLTFFDRVRFGINTLRLANLKNIPKLDKYNAKQWLVKKWGKRIYKIVFEPLLLTKFGVSVDKASAAFVGGRIGARVRSRTKDSNGEKLGYYKGGFAKLIDLFIENIKQKGGDLRSGCEIKEIRYNKKKKEYTISYLHNKKNRQIIADHLINTLPLEIFAGMMKGIPEEMIKEFHHIKYQGAICATFGLKKSLSKYYWTNILTKDLPFGVFIEHTKFISRKYYQNHHVYYVGNYVGTEHPYWDMNDKQLQEMHLGGVKKLFPHFNRDDLLWFKIARSRFATPLFTVNFYDQMPKKYKALENLHMAGSYLVYPDSRNINNVLKTGIHAANEVMNRLK